MIYTRMTKEAMKVSFEAHKNQVDKSGLPYVFHPFHLAEEMPDEECTVVALLHDVLEDTEITPDEPRAHGFSETVMDALLLMTHDSEEPYFDYVARLRSNRIARTVKLADLRHNSDTTRLDRITEKDLQRVEKYKKAAAILGSE